ncbi:MAG: tetratricopeptide repeat protein [Omnitrophica bacterium]|nr:tetratricopeptide repeat protein [Candidatus Omnitrophota bacterium]
MRKKQKIVLKSILPIAIAFVSAFIFFVSYNRYLLDKTLANLKISLKKLERIQDPEVRNTIMAILDDTFLMEVAREEIDPTILAKLEFSNQIITKMTQKAQLEDALYFIKDLIKKKEKGRAPILQVLDAISLNLDPSKREENIGAVRAKIQTAKSELKFYKDDELQEKYFEISRFHVLIKEWNKAISYLRKTIEIEANNEIAKKAFFYLGLVHKFKGNFQQAKEIFSKVKHDLEGELSALSYFEEGDSLYRMGRFKEAISVFEQAFEKNPDLQVSQIAQFRAGYIKIYDLGEIEKIDENFSKVPLGLGKESRFSPEEIIKLYDLSEKDIYDSFKEIRDKIPDSELIPAIAKAYRDRGFKLLKEGYGFLEKGRQRLGTNRFVLGEEQFNLAIEIFPKDAISHTGRGLVLYLLKYPDKAVMEIQMARSISSENPLVLANAGFIYTGLGMYDIALRDYLSAIKRAPNKALLHYNLGTLYILKGNYTKARESFRKAKQIDPLFASAYNNVGYILWREKRYKEAKLEFERSTSLNEDSVVAHYNLGIVLYNFEKYEQSKKQFEKVKKIRPAYRKTDWFIVQIKKKQ